MSRERKYKGERERNAKEDKAKAGKARLRRADQIIQAQKPKLHKQEHNEVYYTTLNTTFTISKQVNAPSSFS